MWFDGQRQPNTLYVASVSRGKDSTAMLRAIQLMGWPLDAICSVDVWATQDIPAELPPMVKFKDEWDKKCLEHFGMPVTRLCAQKRSQKEDGAENSKLTKLTYEDIFYRPSNAQKAKISGVGWTGFPNMAANWCNSELKRRPITDFRGNCSMGRAQGCTCELKITPNQTDRFFNQPRNEGQKINIVHYVGIAADEPIRIARHTKDPKKILPLAQIGWDEALCGLETTYLDMLAPTYTDGKLRDGCWFCHNQGVDSLRRLRHDYPDLWKLLMKWDTDSPVTFHADGHTVHDFDRRFQLEDEGLIDPQERFKWSMLENPQMRWF